MLAYALATGVIFGLYYALVGVGMNLVFGVMRIVNLAHGDFIMLGAFGAFWLFRGLGLPPPVVVVAELRGVLPGSGCRCTICWCRACFARGSRRCCR